MRSPELGADALPSILYRQAARAGPAGPAVEPEFCRDLNLDQIVAAVIAGRDKYDLQSCFHLPLDDADDIAYRQEVMRELEAPHLAARVAAFTTKFDEILRLRRASEEAHYRISQEGWFLEAVAGYCQALAVLLGDLDAAALGSRGFVRFREYLSEYLRSAGFQALAAQTTRLVDELRDIRYCLLIRGLSVTVRDYAEEADYSSEIEATFARFRRGEVNNYHQRFFEYTGMGHVDAQILEGLASLKPSVFTGIHRYFEKHQSFVDAVVERFACEVQFYRAYLQYIDRLRHAGLPFCYPVVSGTTKAEVGHDVFDLALAAKRSSEQLPIVPNDFYLDESERVLVVSGPNQGGKTTFARTIGQLHYLARLGCPVPGRKVRLFLCDRMFTHFERAEDATRLRGKLHDDLLRIRHILAEATPRSLIVMNEIFSSTALEDAVFLTTSVMRMVLARGCLAVCVTFLEEAAALGDGVVSMVSAIDPHDPAVRTFRLERRPADGRAYAIAIAEKWRLTYHQVMGRLAS